MGDRVPFDDPEQPTPEGECPHCGNDLSRAGGVYGVYWVPTKVCGAATPDGHIILNRGNPGEPLWDWDSEDGPNRKEFRCGECGRELDLVERWA